MKRPQEHEYSSFTAYARALENYCTSLGQPEQKPYAWADAGSNRCSRNFRPDWIGPIPLYTSPLKREPLTDRDNAIIRFAVHRFMSDAYARLNAAAQDKDNRHFSPGAVDAFAKDAKDAEALLARLPAAHGIKGDAP